MSLPNCPLCNYYAVTIQRTVSTGEMFRIACGRADCGLATKCCTSQSRAREFWEDLYQKIHLRKHGYQAPIINGNIQSIPLPHCNHSSPQIGCNCQNCVFLRNAFIDHTNKNPLPVDQTGEGEATKDDFFGEL